MERIISFFRTVVALFLSCEVLVLSFLQYLLSVVFMGGFACMILLGIWGLGQEIVVKHTYAYILPLIITIPLAVYAVGAFLLYICLLWSKQAAKIYDIFTYRPKNIQERVQPTTACIKLCKVIFFLALIQFLIALMTGNSTESDDPLLAVAIILMFASGMGWFSLASFYYFDIRAIHQGRTRSALDIAADYLISLTNLMQCVFNPFYGIRELTRRATQSDDDTYDNRK